MNTLEKIEYLISVGFKYDKLSGDIIRPSGKIINSKVSKHYPTIQFKIDRKTNIIYQHQFAFYYIHKFLPKIIDHIG